MNIIPSIFHNQSEIKSGMSTRLGAETQSPFGMNMSFTGGDTFENVQKSREYFLAQFGLTPSQLAIPQQSHTDVIKIVTQPGEYESCDGLITAIPNVFLSIKVADCAAVIVYDVEKHVCGAFHAGWRGAAAGIVKKGIAMMVEEFNCESRNILSFVSPCAGVCCYEIGCDVAPFFKEKVLSVRNRKLYLNMKEEIKSQLVSEGLPEKNIEIHPDCTICKGDVYHSYRRDGEKSGRMMAFIGKIK